MLEIGSKTFDYSIRSFGKKWKKEKQNKQKENNKTNKKTGPIRYKYQQLFSIQLSVPNCEILPFRSCENIREVFVDKRLSAVTVCSILTRVYKPEPSQPTATKMKSIGIFRLAITVVLYVKCFHSPAWALESLPACYGVCGEGGGDGNG